jgi:hypothetical protein
LKHSEKVTFSHPFSIDLNVLSGGFNVRPESKEEEKKVVEIKQQLLNNRPGAFIVSISNQSQHALHVHGFDLELHGSYQIIGSEGGSCKVDGKMNRQLAKNLNDFQAFFKILKVSRTCFLSHPSQQEIHRQVS